MIQYMDITSFTEWFWNTFTTLAGEIINKIDSIQIYNNVTLLDFCIAIIIVGIVITILTTYLKNAGSRLGKDIK